MKKIITTLLVLLFLAGGATWYFVTYRLDGTIERALENAGLTALGSSVQVGSVKTSIKDGSLTISGLTVANPPGYDSEHAISFNQIVAAVDYESFDIDRVIIENPEVIIEEKGGKSNFSDMLARLEGGDSKEEAPQGGDQPVITIRHFKMNQTSAAFKSKSLEADSELNVKAIELNNVTGTPAEVANVIAKEIVGKLSAAAAAEILKAQARKKLGLENDGEKESLGDKIKGIFDQDKD
jgi:hypothetical protein